MSVADEVSEKLLWETDFKSDAATLGYLTTVVKDGTLKLPYRSLVALSAWQSEKDSKLSEIISGIKEVSLDNLNDPHALKQKI